MGEIGDLNMAKECDSFQPILATCRSSSELQANCEQWWMPSGDAGIWAWCWQWQVDSVNIMPTCRICLTMKLSMGLARMNFTDLLKVDGKSLHCDWHLGNAIEPERSTKSEEAGLSTNKASLQVWTVQTKQSYWPDVPCMNPDTYVSHFETISFWNQLCKALIRVVHQLFRCHQFSKQDTVPSGGMIAETNEECGGGKTDES